MALDDGSFSWSPQSAVRRSGPRGMKSLSPTSAAFGERWLQLLFFLFFFPKPCSVTLPRAVDPCLQSLRRFSGLPFFLQSVDDSRCHLSDCNVGLTSKLTLLTVVEVNSTQRARTFLVSFLSSVLCQVFTATLSMTWSVMLSQLASSDGT